MTAPIPEPEQALLWGEAVCADCDLAGPDDRWVLPLDGVTVSTLDDLITAWVAHREEAHPDG